jgi:hypothetical protein
MTPFSSAEAVRLGEGVAASAGHPTCGTESGYTLHRRHGEQPCHSCKLAHSAANRRRRLIRKARHGGPEGLIDHARNGSPVCDPCLGAACYAERWATKQYLLPRPQQVAA